MPWLPWCILDCKIHSVLIVMRCTFSLWPERALMYPASLERVRKRERGGEKRPWAKAAHAEPSPLVINNIACPLKAQCCESFLLNHYSHSCKHFISGLCVAKKKKNILSDSYLCNATENLQLNYWICFALLALATCCTHTKVDIQ